MYIGGENRVGCLRRSHLEKFVEQCGLGKVGITAEGCANLIAQYSLIIPGRLAEIFDELETTSAVQAARELRARMELPIAELCEKTRRFLELI